MIEIVKNSNISFLLKIDIQGIKEILMYTKEKSSNNKECLQVIYLGKKIDLEIRLSSDIDDMIVCEDFIEVYMDGEELEYLEQRLENALKSKCFYPAEICERRYKSSYVTLYCEIIK